MTLSTNERTAKLEKMAGAPLDLLVIGGGITGAGIALDATVRGLRVGLVDMQDFAGGTSSRSTKLVHGGLRYLKQLEVKVVAEVGKERAIVYENAPHVTSPEKMMLPIYKKGTFGRFSTSLGLKVYDFLAGVKKEEHRVMLSRKQTLAKEPLLKKEGLKGSGYYVEYRTDDARLTIEVMKEASDRGALAVNYAKVDELIYDANHKLTGVRVVDQLNQKEYRIFAKKIVNAAGPWVDTIREKDHSKEGKHLHLTKGVHIVIDGKRFPMKQSLYFDTTNGDKRMIFVIPRDGKVYAGTTDTTYSHWPIDPKPTLEDRDYILAAINGMFPSVHLTANDVESSWAGVRPLIQEEGKSPSEISRKDEIFIANSGLISIAGGKLTGYRKMAERVVDTVTKQLGEETGKSYPECRTIAIELSGGHFGGSKHYIPFVQEQIKIGAEQGLKKETVARLVKKYGTNSSVLFHYLRTNREEAISYQLPQELLATLQYGLNEEMVVSPVDYFTRRSGMTLFSINEAKKWAKPVMRYMADQLKWTDQQKEHYADELAASFHDASDYGAASRDSETKAV
ncbi:glycerol-3-phosphate dehydrogenase/oxidase [Sporolactobacillus inulinus]|uniref:Glycerol-3-phosphate dehydrogenase n=1 Tax=Sporolactobacillus inulinus CASD TaxID=1069536 RepID=A0A0U1QNS7_9BACL|nr:glycerol-3-phosphate dehydrogenase/oxidase [Sporolactobacillus inulinus]KLI02451.1 glycerol-3-phosphate dehydrogenase [Sporolactobacillus inulinus CASD]GEB75779.1 aerobic glycerol-3-phosphate dehydrogenase [Sporolactobacillus inulinus]